MVNLLLQNDNLRFNLIGQSKRPFSRYLWTFNLCLSGKYHIIILQEWNLFSVVFEICVWQTSLPEGKLQSHIIWNQYSVRRPRLRLDRMVYLSIRLLNSCTWICILIREMSS